MAKKDSSKGPSFTELQSELNRQIREADFSHVYLLYGEQDYLRLQNRDKLRQAILGDGDAMNSTTFSGASLQAAQVVETAETLPFFAERRVIVIENTGLFGQKAGPEAEKLAEYIKGGVPDTTYLVFVEESVNRTMKLYKAVSAAGFVLPCESLDETSLRRWVMSLFAKEKLGITSGALQRFLDSTGDDMLNIKSEAEKLISYCLGKPGITEQDVADICSVRTKDRIFDMISAIADHNSRLALEIYGEMITLRTPPQVILSLMIRQYNQLLQAKELLSGTGERETAQLLHLNPWILSNKIRPVLRGYSTEELTGALGSCVQADTDYKMGKIDAQLAVEKLIVICSRPKVRQQA